MHRWIYAGKPVMCTGVEQELSSGDEQEQRLRIAAMRTRKAMCVGGGRGRWWGEGLIGDVGAGVDCSLHNFYATLESNLHQFRAGGFKRGIGNFATKRR